MSFIIAHLQLMNPLWIAYLQFNFPCKFWECLIFDLICIWQKSCFASGDLVVSWDSTIVRSIYERNDLCLNSDNENELFIVQRWSLFEKWKNNEQCSKFINKRICRKAEWMKSKE